jgi:hypothetical protein
LRAEGIHYVVIEDAFFKHAQDTLPQWLVRNNAVVDRQWGFLEDPYEPPEQFYLLHLQNP